MRTATLALGLTLIAAAVLVAVGLRIGQVTTLPLGALPIALLLAAAGVLHLGRRRPSRAAAPTDLITPGPRVLYLRPFTADPSTVDPALRPRLVDGLLSGLGSEEKELAEVLRPIGRMVTIGRPGELRAIADPTVGNSEWMAIVDAQLGLARLTVLRIDPGAELDWEMHRARELVEPTRLLLLAVGLGNHEFRQAAARAELALDVTLPPGGSTTGFYRFSDDWQPHFLAVRPSSFRRDSSLALRPVFERFATACAEPRHPLRPPFRPRQRNRQRRSPA